MIAPPSHPRDRNGRYQPPPEKPARTAAGHIRRGLFRLSVALLDLADWVDYKTRPRSKR